MSASRFSRPDALTARAHNYCPGCGHGIAHRLVAEVIDELGVRERTIAVAPVGCAVFAYDYWNFDVTEAPHGRPPAVATGIKRVLPDRIVFTYQGDGDLAAIGTAEIIHAANRGENFTTVFVNNTVYGMTSGQMAPTTLPGQRTLTTPAGRDPGRDGHPLRVTELVASLDGVVYAARASIATPSGVRTARARLLEAFRHQLAGDGFSLVELLSPCPAGLGMEPVTAAAWVAQELEKYYPVHVFKNGR
jgi:2-oxoglutarate ferredoxin oxidoreductase subunit beta